MCKLLGFLYYNELNGKISYIVVPLIVAGIFENIKLLSDLFEFLNIKVEEEEMETDTLVINFPSLDGDGILVKDLSFSYGNDNQLRLKNVSFQIWPGQRVAIVGDNGAGKSTLIKCLIGLYRNYTGHIFYERNDLKHMSAKLVFQHVGAVFQDFSKYDFSVKENIGVGDIDHLADEERIRTAAEKSGANVFIEKLENQYETEVGSSFVQSTKRLSKKSSCHKIKGELIRLAQLYV